MFEKIRTKMKSICTLSQVQAAVGVSLASSVVGFTSAWTSPAIPSLQLDPTVQITDQQASWIGSLMPLAALLGGLVGGTAIEKIGRKMTIIATALPFIVAGLVVAFANGVYMLYIGRSISGFCIGVISVSLPMYLAESIQPEVRGTLGVLPTSLGNLGVMLCYILGAFLNWSHLALVSSILPVPFLIMMCLIPETPRYLISRGKEVEALESLEWLRGSTAEAESEFSTIKKSQLESDRSGKSGFLTAPDLKPLFVCVGLMLFQQFSGINAVMFYSVSIFKDSGSTSPHTSTIILGVVNIFATMISNLLIDRLGRKILLYTSAVGMMLSLGLLGLHYYMLNITEPFIHTPLIALVIYIISFSFGFGPVPWLIMGEILPARSRGLCASITTSTNWASTFLVTKTFIDLRNSLGAAGVFWLFGSVCCLAVVFVLLCVPETRGISLEDIESIFNPGMKRLDECEEIKLKRNSIANLKATPSQLL